MSVTPTHLYGFFRSAAAFRVRIALKLKGIEVTHSYLALRKGEQRAPDFLKLNPQGLVPALTLSNGEVLTQSLAILDYLGGFLPRDKVKRGKVLAFSLAIAADIHPIQNLGVLERLRKLGIAEDNVTAFAHDVNVNGLSACENMIDGKTKFCFGNTPSMADICLIPQLYNARRFGADVSGWTKLLRVEANALALPAFHDSQPQFQPDAV
jgi:maleylpyruvate isomerase